MSEKFNLTWHTFASHGQELFKNLLRTQEFTDVTLISDDQHQYKVHKFILCACSTVFRKILTKNPLNSSIYLRGIHLEELESILQFIYFGEATFYHERIKEFLNVAKNLDIKEIGKNFVDEEEEGESVRVKQCSDEAEESEDLNDNQSFDAEDLINSNEDQSNDVTILNSRKSKVKDIYGLSSKSLILGDNGNKPYKCNQCDYQSSYKRNFKEHVEFKHEGIKQSCQQCNNQFSTLANLQKHIKEKHEGIKYPCQHCDYQATQQQSLQRHMLRKH